MKALKKGRKGAVEGDELWEGLCPYQED